MPMRAFALESFGQKGSVMDLPDPVPQQGQVLVRVKAAGVNVFDAWVVQGAMKDAMEHRFPLIPGVEASGIVESPGDGVTDFKEGDEVYGVSVKPFLGEGTFSELATFGPDALSAKPGSVDFVGAAALPHTGLTALTALEEIDPQKDQIVLIVGATGGVGSFLTQLAAGRGATVVAVAGADRAAYARELGAVETIDYSKGDLLEQVRAAYPDGIDALVDLYGDPSGLTRLSEVVRSGGVVLSTSGATDPEMLAQRGLRGGNINRASPQRLPELTRLVDEKELQSPPTMVHPLDRAGEALEEIQSRHVRGKLVISLE
jgi:NADPH:quinone reductase-like Zn-dependent oxidoreductase